MDSSSGKTQGCHSGDPYDMHPRIILDTCKPEDPSRTVGISTLARRRLRQIELCSPYGMFLVVAAILELNVYVVVG